MSLIHPDVNVVPTRRRFLQAAGTGALGLLGTSLLSESASAQRVKFSILSILTRRERQTAADFSPVVRTAFSEKVCLSLHLFQAFSFWERLVLCCHWYSVKAVCKDKF